MKDDVKAALRRELLDQQERLARSGIGAGGGEVTRLREQLEAVQVDLRCALTEQEKRTAHLEGQARNVST